MLPIMTLATLAAVQPATAASKEPRNAVHLVYGSYQASDSAWDLYSPNDALGAAGLRAERQVYGPISLVGGYTRRTVSSEYFDSLVESDRMPEREEAALVAAFTGQQFTIGPKVGIDIRKRLNGYVLGKGLVFAGTSRLDDAPDEEGNLNEIRNRGLAPGFVAAGGLEYRPQIGPVSLSTFLELGYHWTAQMGFEDDRIRSNGTNQAAAMGDVAFRGLYVQTGIGVRF